MEREPAYYLNLYKKQLLTGVGLFIVILAVSIVGINIWLAERREGLESVEILTVPKDSKVTLSTGEVIGSGTAYLKPGDYTTKTSHEGFHSYERELKVKEGEVNTLYIGLAPKTEEAEEWARWNRRAYGELEHKTRELGVTYTMDLKTDYPIVEDLPLKDPYFSVGYKASEDYGIIVTIKGTSPRYRQAAIQAIEAKGYNLGEYVVEYQGFDNPLEEKKGASDE